VATTIEKEVKSSPRTWQGLLPPEESKEDFRPPARLRDEDPIASRPHRYQQPWRVLRFGIPKTFSASPTWSAFKEIDPRAIVNVGELRSTSAIAPPYPVRIGTDLHQWPRLLQMFSIALLIGSMLMSTGEILTAAGGLLLGFIALTILFFANYAAWRQGVPGFIGPHVSMLGTACSLTISVAIAVNLIVS
jgi:hypothetical protein